MSFPPRFSNLLYTVNIKAPGDSIVPTSLTLPEDGLFIAYTVRDDVNYYYLSKDDVWTHYYTSIGSVDTNLAFHVPRKLLVQSRKSYSHISYMLDKVEIPMDEQPQIISKIQQEILSIVKNPSYAPPRIMPILVEIIVSVCRDISPYMQLSSDSEEEIAINMSNLSMDEEEPTTTPASRFAIEFLEKVKIGAIDDHDQKGFCTICFEEFLEGVEIIYMPCKHAFHGECIKKWLEKSNVCPLCRFAMPTDDDTNE